MEQNYPFFPDRKEVELRPQAFYHGAPFSTPIKLSSIAMKGRFGGPQLSTFQNR
jgi:hypothetical protein